MTEAIAVSELSNSLKEEIIDKYGQGAWDLILTVYVNFYYSELEIIDLCARWLPRRNGLREKNFLIRHAADEVVHARLFREGVERLGQPWHEFDHDAYRIDDIGERFAKLFYSDDEIEVLIGLNLYAEGVLAMEELYQLGQSKSPYSISSTASSGRSGATSPSGSRSRTRSSRPTTRRASGRWGTATGTASTSTATWAVSSRSRSAGRWMQASSPPTTSSGPVSDLTT